MHIIIRDKRKDYIFRMLLIHANSRTNLTNLQESLEENRNSHKNVKNSKTRWSPLPDSPCQTTSQQLTLERTEQYSCKVASVFGGSFASRPSSVLNMASTNVVLHFNREASMSGLISLHWLARVDASRMGRAASAKVLRAISSWCVAVIWSIKKVNSLNRKNYGTT